MPRINSPCVAKGVYNRSYTVGYEFLCRHTDSSEDRLVKRRMTDDPTQVG
ncbi:hypothetical protein [Fervidibacter sp.]